MPQLFANKHNTSVNWAMLKYCGSMGLQLKKYVFDLNSLLPHVPLGNALNLKFPTDLQNGV